MLPLFNALFSQWLFFFYPRALERTVKYEIIEFLEETESFDTDVAMEEAYELIYVYWSVSSEEDSMTMFEVVSPN